MGRADWAELGDDQLLAQCAVDTYRASGPGGQKRNKTSSAVRLRHQPSGLLVIAEESRSQHENRARALKRLRQALYLELREPLPPDGPAGEAVRARPEWAAALSAGGRLSVGPKDPRYWPAAGLVLDVLEATSARVGDAADVLGLTTGNLIGFLREHPKVWEQANRLRARFGHKPLR